VTTLPKPGAGLPAPPAPSQLLDLFLAGRKPKTLATCQADLEDFRRFMEASSLAGLMEKAAEMRARLAEFEDDDPDGAGEGVQRHRPPTSPNAVHFTIRMAVAKSVRVIGCGARGRSG
jgi:hypothetical protein